MLTYSGPILILVFLLVTILISTIEKLFMWNKTLQDYKLMYEKHLPTVLVKFTLLFIIAFEIIITILFTLGIYTLVMEQDIYLSEVVLILTGILFIILLIGLRILQDYNGAGKMAIYFLLTVFGLFWLQSI